MDEKDLTDPEFLSLVYEFALKNMDVKIPYARHDLYQPKMVVLGLIDAVHSLGLEIKLVKKD